MIESKSIKLFLWCFVQLIILLPQACVAHTQSETNALVHAKLNNVRCFASYPIEIIEELDEKDIPNTWETFLGVDETNGWTFAEKKCAFENCLMLWSTNDYRLANEEDKSLMRVAIGQCKDLRDLECLPAMRRLVLNPHGVYREEALELILALCPVDNLVTTFIETVFTNKLGHTYQERELAGTLYAQKISTTSATNELQQGNLNSGVQMFYRNRMMSAVSAYKLDELFVLRIPGYQNSSNRLATAISVLNQADATERDRVTFIAITNQLLSSGQPLQWITVGDTP